MGYVQPVLVLVGLKHHIQPVSGIGLLPLGYEYQVLRVLRAQFHIAFLDMLLEGWVDFDYPSLAGLLLKEDEGIPGKEVIPGQAEKVADAEAEIYAAANQERDGVIPVIIQAVHKGNSLVPFQRFGG